MLDSTDILRELAAKRKAFRAAIEAKGRPEIHEKRAPYAVPTSKKDEAVARAEIAAEHARKERARLAAEKAEREAEEARLAAIAVELEERLAYLESRHAEIMTMVEAGLQNRPSVSEIIRIVCERYGVPVDDIMSSRRTANVVRPRQIAMYLSRVLTIRSMPYIARSFGGRDHTTILHAVRKINAMMYGGSSPRFSRGHYASGRVKSFEPDPAFRHHVELIATDIVDRMLRAKAKERADVG